MKKTIQDDSVGLIVPIDLLAFCIGIQDANGQYPATSTFAGPTTSFINQTASSQAFLGENVAMSMENTPFVQLKEGIHLHFALPDALTSGTTKAGKLALPPSPNRWLVTRLLVSGSSVQAKSWVIESDTTSLTSPSDQPITLPINYQTNTFCYVGRSWKLSDGPPATLLDPLPSIKDLTGSELCPVSSGVTSFAAYYPNCRNVFGFYDPLSDADDPKTGGNLTYVVQGWYANAANDPLSGGCTVDQLQTNYGWTLANEEKTPTFSTYYGTVQNVIWDPNKIYIPLVNGKPKPIQANVTIGNSQAEVLSSYFRQQSYPQAPFFEKMLHNFQLGKLYDFSLPKTDQVAKLGETLYKDFFSQIDAGTVYAIVPSQQAASSSQSKLTDIPSQLGDALNTLNEAQQLYDFYEDHLNASRSQLFSDWYHIFKISDDTQAQNAAAYKAQLRYTQVKNTILPLRNTYAQNLQTSLSSLQSKLGTNWSLQKNPAPRYFQPNEPIVMITGLTPQDQSDLCFPKRYGGDGSYRADQYLMCRLTSQYVQALSINGGASIQGSSFTDIKIPTSQQVPFASVFSDLLQEACLLNTTLIGAMTSVSSSALETALEALLDGSPQTCYQLTGMAPSPVAMNWWAENPWQPVFMQWTASFLPLQSTVDGETLTNYPTDFFQSNYTIGALDDGGSIQYLPTGAPIDPSKEPFPWSYEGHISLSPSASSTFSKHLSKYLGINHDSTLEAISTKLQDSNVLVQPLSGLNYSLLMRKPIVQLNVQVDPSSSFSSLTKSIATLVDNTDPANNLTNIPKIGLDFGPQSSFNPIRAGYLQLSLSLVDPFGQKRELDFTLNCSASMTTVVSTKTIPGIAYLAPRLTQPSRLLFRWLAANGESTEMNSHPDTSPICGWLLPNHVGNPSLFAYSASGESLGILYIAENAIKWQSAAGNNKTINESIEDTLAFENSYLRSFLVSLTQGSVDKFTAIIKSMDTVSDTITGQGVSSKSSMGVLAGKPIALAQTSLRLELQGGPVINQTKECYTDQGVIETDSGFTSVEFPVILGDLSRTNDGLVGYFKQSKSSDYDLSTYYTEVAFSVPGIARPGQGTMLLTAAPLFDANDAEPPALESCDKRVLMLIDPRASVHATTGILPQYSIMLPPDMCQDALSKLEMFFRTNTILKGSTAFVCPTPKEEGFQFSWVEQVKNNGTLEWLVTPDIQSVPQKGVSAYTPQMITEGWLQLNPVLLDFSFLNTDTGKPSVSGGVANSLTLNIENKKLRPISFNAGQSAPEGNTLEGNCIFYIHFGNLVAEGDLSKIQFATEDGWSFQVFSSSFYGDYLAVIWTNTKQPYCLANGETLSIKLTNVITSKDFSSARVYFDYYNITGIGQGVCEDNLMIQLQEVLI